MAKYRLKNSNNKVTCEVLNESMNNYIVRFRNGVVQSVPKNRVSNLDYIDEAVLDDIRDTVTKYGRKFVSKTKDIAKKVVDFFVKPFVAGGAIYFADNNGIANVNHPANIVAAALNDKNINFYPSDATNEVLKMYGLKSGNIENFEFSGDKYEDPFADLDEAILANMTNESVSYHKRYIKSLLRTLNEEQVKNINSPYLNAREGVMLQSPVGVQRNTKEIVDEIVRFYESVHKGIIEPDGSYLIYGAPGIGKSAIVASMKDLLRSKGYDINVIPVNASNIGPEYFAFPAIVDDEKIQRELSTKLDKLDFRTRNFLKSKTKSAVDLSKSWLPFYDDTIEDKEEREWHKKVANGAKFKVVDNKLEFQGEGDGGIIFVDEYTRMSLAGEAALLTLIANRNISGNIRLGDRWIVVCAANRCEDLSDDALNELPGMSSPQANRYAVVNYVPEPEEWLSWAKSMRTNKKDGSQRTQVIKEVTDYISNEVSNNSIENNWGDYYNVWKYNNAKDKNIDRRYPNASPRTWKLASDNYIACYYASSNPELRRPLNEWEYSDVVAEFGQYIGDPVAKRFAASLTTRLPYDDKDLENILDKGVNESNKGNYECLNKEYAQNRTVKTFLKMIIPDMANIYSNAELKSAKERPWHLYQFLHYYCFDQFGRFLYNVWYDINYEIGTNHSLAYNIDYRWITANMTNNNQNPIHMLATYKAVMEKASADGLFNPQCEFERGFTIDDFEKAYKLTSSSGHKADDIIEILIQ